MEKQPAVYILASKRNGTLYIGVTSDLTKRVWEHKSGMVEGFTKRYRVHRLVWYELHERMESAIINSREIELTSFGTSPLPPLFPPGLRPYGPAAKEG